MIKTIFHASGYESIENIELDELKTYIVDEFYDFWCNGIGEGYIEFFNDNKLVSSLYIGPNEDYGIYLKFINEETYDELLSLYDSNLLDEVVETSDEIYVSKGLFLPIELAWIGIKEYILKGTLTNKINWVNPEIIPEGGNW